MELNNIESLSELLRIKLAPSPNIQQWHRELAQAALEIKDDMDAGLDLALDLAAIMERESNGGAALSPSGPSGTGDHGHGRGLMQMDDRAHPKEIALKDKDGNPLWQKALENIRMGRDVYVLELRRYGGVKEHAIPAYNCGAGNVNKALAQKKDPDSFTAAGPSGHPDYGKDVLHRRAKWA